MLMLLVFLFRTNYRSRKLRFILDYNRNEVFYKQLSSSTENYLNKDVHL